MSIYITGDIHGNIDINKLSFPNFPEGRNLTKKDYVIICGDFGLLWNNSKEELYWRKWLNEKPWTTLYVDGNHENFNLLEKFKVEEWNGGKIQKIESSIYHLMRGQIFTIDNKTFFTMGGAKSTDKANRIPEISWWKQEEPTYKETELGLNNLEANNNKVDYIISHTCPMSVIYMFDRYPIIEFTSNLNNYFDVIKDRVIFNDWYFGHFHEDIELGKYHLLYEKIIKLF